MYIRKPPARRLDTAFRVVVTVVSVCFAVPNRSYLRKVEVEVDKEAQDVMSVNSSRQMQEMNVQQPASHQPTFLGLIIPYPARVIASNLSISHQPTGRLRKYVCSCISMQWKACN
ncbi:hypothetical protein TWF970_001724, partial [Orbilia oligospora]